MSFHHLSLAVNIPALTVNTRHTSFSQLKLTFPKNHFLNNDFGERESLCYSWRILAKNHQMAMFGQCFSWIFILIYKIFSIGTFIIIFLEKRMINQCPNLIFNKQLLCHKTLRFAIFPILLTSKITSDVRYILVLVLKHRKVNV